MEGLEQQKGPSPPRFKSFKPLQKVKEEAEKTTNSATGQENDPFTKKNYSRPYKAYHEIDHGFAESKYPEQISKSSKTAAALRKADKQLDDGQNLFIRDTRGDQENLKYGVSGRYSGPRYRESGSRRVLGLSRRFRTKPSQEHGLQLVTTDQPDNDQRDQRKLSDLRVAREPEVVLARNTSGIDMEADSRLSFLPFRDHARKRRKVQRESSVLPTNSPDNSKDFNITSRDRERDQAENSEYETEASTSDASLQSDTPPDRTRLIREENARLSRLVQKDPSKVDVWLALIEHQEALLAVDGHAKHELTKAETRGLADIRISLYEKALSKISGNNQQNILVQGMMREGAKVWDTKKLSWAWNSTLEAHSENADLWMEFLTFQQTTHLGFSYKQTLKHFEKFFAAVKGEPTETVVSHRMDEIKVYLLLRLTVFIRDAGFSEQALGLWQAMIEYNHFWLSGDLEDFQLFWDSEMARFGDAGARGWNKSISDQLPVTVAESSIKVPSRETFTTWTDDEKHRTASSTLPAYTGDDTEPVDDYTFALFSDLRPFLFRLVDEKARLSLIGSLLAFHGLPSKMRELSSSLFFSGDPFIGERLVEGLHDLLQPWIDQPTSPSLFAFPVNSFVLDTSTLFARDGKWFNPWKNLATLSSNQPHSDWLRRALRQLTTVEDSDDLAEYVVALEAQFDFKGARKLAKFFLKKRNSVRLYNTVALIEANHGTFSNAEQVWSSTIAMEASFSESGRSEIGLVWLSWLWALLDKGEVDRASRLCLALPTGKFCTSDLNSNATDTESESYQAAVQRSIEYLFGLLEESLRNNQPHSSLYSLDLLALTAYLTSHRHLPAALAHYTTFSTHPTITTPPTTLNLLHQSRARLIHLHTSTQPRGFRARDITTPLAASLALFPCNTIFLSLYHHHTRHALLTDRIREVIPTLAQSQPQPRIQPPKDPHLNSPSYPLSLIPPLFHLWTEFHRPSFAGHTSAAIRSTFETCAAGPAAHSPYLWTLWMLWEEHVAVTAAATTKAAAATVGVVTGARKPKKGATRRRLGAGEEDRVVELVYRALRACPWSKRVGVVGMRVLEGVVARAEREARAGLREQVKGVYEMMVERGVRVLAGEYWEPEFG